MFKKLHSYKLDDDPDPDCEICKETTGIYRHEFDQYLCDDDYDLMREKLLK